MDKVVENIDAVDAWWMGEEMQVVHTDVAVVKIQWERATSWARLPGA